MATKKEKLDWLRQNIFCLALLDDESFDKLKSEVVNTMVGSVEPIVKAKKIVSWDAVTSEGGYFSVDDSSEQQALACMIAMLAEIRAMLILLLEDKK